MKPTPEHRFATAVVILCVLAVVAACSPQAQAKSYKDVPKSHWAYTAISAVTSKGAAGERVLDDYGKLFKPNQAITRAEMARAVVIAAGVQAVAFNPRKVGDVPVGHQYYTYVQVALKYKFMSLDKAGNFNPGKLVKASTAETVVVRWLKRRYPSSSWKLLSSLSRSKWEPNVGWSPKAPSYLPYIVASRQLQLRVNHASNNDDREVTPREPISRAEVASMLKQGYDAGSTWRLYGLADFADVTFPPMSARQREIAAFALKYIGYPYVWAGEYPTCNSPYGYQLAGGFDCSGFVFYIMKMKFGYPITVNERGGSDMAKNAKPRITRKELTAGDVIFFAPNGPKSSVGSIFHVGLYLGNGWFIHSTGSSDGVTLASLDSSEYWKSNFAWGRRFLSKEELALSEPAVE